MSPRGRLRTRYQPGGPAAPAPAPPQPSGSLSAGAAAEPASPVASPKAPPAPAEPAQPAGSPPAPGAPVESERVITGSSPAVASAEPAPMVAAPAAPAPMALPGRPSAEVIEEWAKAFEEPAPATEAPKPPPTPRRRFTLPLRSILTWLTLAMLAFATGLLLFNYFVMPRLIHGVGQVKVPDLTNLTVEQAEQALRPLGLRVSRAGERFDPAAPRGFVVAQDPEAGSNVRGSKRVSVIVSLGEEYSSVPELFGESVRGARVLLERAGLQQGSTVQAPSEEAGEGLVTASDPGAEAVLQRNTPVHILVSTGTEAESFVMPELLGREIGGVRRQLEAMGFRIERTGSRTSVGTIVAQVPAPGSRITRATVIKLTASGRIIR